MLCLNNFRNVHQIEKENIEDINEDIDNLIGEGKFGTCMKKVYRGHVVAVKYYRGGSLASDVEKEAMMINTFDRPGEYLTLSQSQFQKDDVYYVHINNQSSFFLCMLMPWCCLV